MSEYNYVEQRAAFAEKVKELRANYGEDKFAPAKCDLIWNELREFSPKQIRNVCAVVMSEQQFAPVLMHFQEKASLLREKIREWERQQERFEADRFWEQNKSLPRPNSMEESE